MGVISLNLPMIYAKSIENREEFYTTLDYYMNLARGIHKKTIAHLSKLKASCSPLAFMEGGFDDGYLNADDSIAPVLKHSTISFGYGGLAELQYMMKGTDYVDDQSAAKEVLQHINDNIARYKKEDNILYALYGTPGESWLPRACNQFIAKYGNMEGVTDKGFFTNSFHVNVDADITPVEKINIESKMFPLSKGGAICHVKIPAIGDEMLPAVKSIIRYGMTKGTYQSVNHAQNRCTDCGHHWIGDDTKSFEENYKCPNCGSFHTIGIRRMNGLI